MLQAGPFHSDKLEENYKFHVIVQQGWEHNKRKAWEAKEFLKT